MVSFMFNGKRSWRIWALTFALAAMLVCIAPRAGAQDNDQDPPSRVARLSYVNGSVSFQPAGADQDDWGDAEQNRPITTGDKLWADQDGRAEVRLGGSAMRIAPNTAFTFLNLTDTTTQISVSEGELNLHLRRLGKDQSFEVDTPNLAFTALRPGDYTIIVNENGDTTWITVRSGDGEITGGGQAFNLNAGQIGTFAGTDSLEGDVDQASGPDEFEGWAMQRNQHLTGRRCSTCRTRWWAMKICRTTAIGATIRNTGTCGCRAWRRVGRRIGMGIGRGSRHGDGLG